MISDGINGNIPVEKKVKKDLDWPHECYIEVHILVVLGFYLEINSRSLLKAWIVSRPLTVVTT